MPSIYTCLITAIHSSSKVAILRYLFFGICPYPINQETLVSGRICGDSSDSTLRKTSSENIQEEGGERIDWMPSALLAGTECNTTPIKLSLQLYILFVPAT